MASRSCGTMQNYYRLLDRDPGYRLRQGHLQSLTASISRRNRERLARDKITIPVVVHILEHKDGAKVTLGQVKSQIKELNACFGGKNSDLKSGTPKAFQTLIGKANIRFTLADRDPQGKPTKGVLRKRTPLKSWCANDSMKIKTTGGSEPWDTRVYLNIWVCELSDGLLGYAQFPGGPSDTDGVVINSTAFGRGGATASSGNAFDMGRTAVHEVGHWLNLSHIWGEARLPSCNDSDYVSDTPNQFEPNEKVPSYPNISCNNGPNGDLFMNFMDYVDDKAMVMFTKGQVERMRIALEVSRPLLGNYNVLGQPFIAAMEGGIRHA